MNRASREDDRGLRTTCKNTGQGSRAQFRKCVRYRDRAARVRHVRTLRTSPCYRPVLVHHLSSLYSVHVAPAKFPKMSTEFDSTSTASSSRPPFSAAKRKDADEVRNPHKHSLVLVPLRPTPGKLQHFGERSTVTTL